MQTGLQSYSKLSTNTEFLLVKVLGACAFERPVLFCYCSLRYCHPELRCENWMSSFQSVAVLWSNVILHLKMGFYI